MLPNAKQKPRKPDWSLSAMQKDTQYKGKVGAGWSQEDGSIQIKLDPFVVLTASLDMSIRLFPADYKKPETGAEKPKSGGKFDDMEDDIPF